MGAGDFLEKEWPLIAGAPHLFWGGIITAILLSAPTTWFVVNWGYRQRLKLADERETFANKVRDDIARQFKEFKEAVAAGAGNDALTARVAKLEASHNELTTANNAVLSVLGISFGTLAATESSDSFSNITLALLAEADKERAE
ncbi:MAG TPA: hypothetical protein VIH87_15125 [Methylocella sp.]